MSSQEDHATRADDWRVYGQNLAAESYYVGGQFNDARRLMLAAWEGWTSGEPPGKDIVNEMLATWYAMAVSCGIDPVGPLLVEMGRRIKDACDDGGQ